VNRVALKTKVNVKSDNAVKTESGGKVSHFPNLETTDSRSG
jgi:hypothetical protein